MLSWVELPEQIVVKVAEAVTRKPLVNTHGEKDDCPVIGPTVPIPAVTPGLPGPACASHEVPFQC